MPDPRIASIQIGPVADHGVANAADPHDRSWTTGMFKHSVEGAIRLGPEGLEGDQQADRKNHGGPDKAINVYPGEHQEAWRRELAMAGLQAGGFGENFTTSGQTEHDVCIGDTFRIGDAAIVQISQPRQPCWKLARRWRMDDLPLRVIRTGRTGWYLRVLGTGLVSAGAALVLVDRPFPAYTIAFANDLMHGRGSKDDMRALSACPGLSANWQQTLARKANTPSTG